MSSPRKQMQPTYTVVLGSEWERLLGRSPLMWLERALSRARSRRSLACSCLGLNGSSSLIAISVLIIKRQIILEQKYITSAVETAMKIIHDIWWDLVISPVWIWIKLDAWNVSWSLHMWSDVIFLTDWHNAEWIKPSS